MDYQDRLTALLLSDSLSMEEAKELRGRIYCLRELQELNLDDIRKVFGLEPVPAETEEKAA